MKVKLVIWTLLMFVAGAAHANQFNTQCAYSHTLPDDPIVYPGKPGEAMVHDFFGNANADAYSTYDSLNNNKVITCDSAADRSAYWTPQLKRASGVISPMYQKTYYKNDQAVVAVQAIPPGLQMLAGDHMGTAPNSHINFLCAGSGSYTTTMPKSCPPISSNSPPSQLNISVHFPDCWDGKTLTPFGSNRANLMSSLMKAAKGQLNVAYRNSDGTCPSAYPVKIPELQMNVAYDLGSDPDLSTAQLSLDPVLQNGTWVPQWGSMYTAHGDFINAWHVQTMQYLVDTCMNKGGDSGGVPGGSCDKSIPVYYSAAAANVQLDGNGAVRPTGATLVSAPGDVILIKFPMPENLDDYPYVGSFLQTLGGNITDTSAVSLYVYAASTDWDDAANLPKASACGTTGSIGRFYADNVQQVRTTDISAYIAAQKQAGAKEIGLCIRNTTKVTFQFSSREGLWAPGLYLK
ncbi:DUF1996 domain-containing protein [Caballeronia sp. LjRoot34]|uniref:DUF1996 domain-containing protein n=1 Tax=Caballeronia sp. LjRoot34 TaxID=3342325 RepID=UPI003ECF6055